MHKRWTILHSIHRLIWSTHTHTEIKKMNKKIVNYHRIHLLNWRWNSCQWLCIGHSPLQFSCIHECYCLWCFMACWWTITWIHLFIFFVIQLDFFFPYEIHWWSTTTSFFSSFVFYWMYFLTVLSCEYIVFNSSTVFCIRN